MARSPLDSVMSGFQPARHGCEFFFLKRLCCFMGFLDRKGGRPLACHLLTCRFAISPIPRPAPLPPRQTPSLQVGRAEGKTLERISFPGLDPAHRTTSPTLSAVEGSRL